MKENKFSKFYIIAGILLLATSAFLTATDSAVAEPLCEWDCMSTDCCGTELGCNGGTYGGVCPTHCLGATAPPGMCL